MKLRNHVLAVLTASALLLPAAFGDEAKTYQVTGSILELSDSKIVVQKGNERWEISRDAATKGAEKLKAGDKVTIHYRMHAARVEVKAAEKGSAK